MMIPKLEDVAVYSGLGLFACKRQGGTTEYLRSWLGTSLEPKFLLRKGPFLTVTVNLARFTMSGFLCWMCSVNGKGGTCANRGLAPPLDLRLAISLSWCIWKNCENHARKMRTFFTRRLEPKTKSRNVFKWSLRPKRK